MGVPPPEFKGAATSMGAKLLRVVCVWLCVCVSVNVHAVCLWCVSVCLSVPCACALQVGWQVQSIWFALLYGRVGRQFIGRVERERGR